MKLDMPFLHYPKNQMQLATQSKNILDEKAFFFFNVECFKNLHVVFAQKPC